MLFAFGIAPQRNPPPHLVPGLVRYPGRAEALASQLGQALKAFRRRPRILGACSNDSRTSKFNELKTTLEMLDWTSSRRIPHSQVAHRKSEHAHRMDKAVTL
ncbi:MAG TPA: hypothetical protein VKI00_24725 [Mycobacterium sp.]|uniref:hypothetical protein n=1 Tax=Mycobacterium sp. TaxID=1785 RepID=UPI002BC668F4|nr:hypothetical protein [Mycobacterium sp.]HME78738.1 hypothetical protein [Mycobacterium sp.]